jgi:hypothetical protein
MMLAGSMITFLIRYMRGISMSLVALLLLLLIHPTETSQRPLFKLLWFPRLGVYFEHEASPKLMPTAP